MAPLAENDEAATVEEAEIAQETTKAAGTAGEVSAAGTVAASGGGLISSSAVRPTASTIPVDWGLAAEELQTVPRPAESMLVGGVAGENGTAVIESPTAAGSDTTAAAARPEAAAAVTAAETEAAEAALSASLAPVAAAVLAAVVSAAAGEQNGARTEEGVMAAAAYAGTPAAAVGADMQGRVQVANDRRGHGCGTTVCAACGKAGKNFRAQPAPRRPGAGLDLASGDPSWAGFCKGSRHESESLSLHHEELQLHNPHRGFRGCKRLRHSSPQDGGIPQPHKPVTEAAPGDGEVGEPDDVVADPGFMGREEEDSEEISLEEERETRRATQARRERTEEGAPHNPTEAGEAATDDTDVPSPSDLAGIDAI
ncbi:unnamed protein product [Closterium sp. Naga37s-1]|nr:unnamed protein product [Closterium sp. Naga37s-1]